MSQEIPLVYAKKERERPQSLWQEDLTKCPNPKKQGGPTVEEANLDQRGKYEPQNQPTASSQTSNNCCVHQKRQQQPLEHPWGSRAQGG
jgi:hypothetical protein